MKLTNFSKHFYLTLIQKENFEIVPYLLNKIKMLLTFQQRKESNQDHFTDKLFQR